MVGAEPPSLFGISAETYDGVEPQAVEFRVTAPGACGASLIGSTREWARDQRAAWGPGIPGLTQYEAQRACGPIAVEALLRFNANNPDLNMIADIFNYAKDHGLWRGSMQGPGSEQKLLEHYGIEVHDAMWGLRLREASDKIIASLACGKPVIISTLSHYFFVEGYGNGLFFVGHTGRSKRGGAARMTISDIYWKGGDPLVLLIPK